MQTEIETRCAFSIDDVEEQFEYQRYPATWSEVNANIDKWDKIKSQVKTIETQICCTINVLNVFNFVKIFINLFNFETHSHNFQAHLFNV